MGIHNFTVWVSFCTVCIRVSFLKTVFSRMIGSVTGRGNLCWQRQQEEEVEVYNTVVCFFSFSPPLVSFNLLYIDLMYLCYFEYCLTGLFNDFSLFNAIYIYIDFWNTNSLFSLIFALHCNLVFANRVGYCHQCKAFVLWTRPSWCTIIVWPVRNFVWLYMTYVVVRL